MRNTISIIDSDIPKPMFTDLSIGEMFRYPHYSNAQNVYMKITPSCGTNAILLATGVGYEILLEGPVERIPSVRISR